MCIVFLVMKLKEDKPEEYGRAAEWEFGVESRKGKILCTVVKYWGRILLMEQDELCKKGKAVPSQA
jgi:hypothetical protein